MVVAESTVEGGAPPKGWVMSGRLSSQVSGSKMSICHAADADSALVGQPPRSGPGLALIIMFIKFPHAAGRAAASGLKTDFHFHAT